MLREREVKERESKRQRQKVREPKFEIYLYLRKHVVHLKGHTYTLPNSYSLHETSPLC